MMESNYTQIETKYKGVRGWLLLFCLGLTAFGPLITIGNLFNSYEELNPYFDLFPGLLNLWIIDSILSICLIIFAIYTGFMLFSIRPGAVKTAKIYLFVALGYSTIASLLLPFIAGLPSEVTQNILQEGIGKFIGACITFAIWYSYLLKSKRVKATYGTVEKERKADKQLKQSEPEVVQLERKEIESEDTLQMEQVVKKQDIEPHRIEQSDIANEQEVDNELKYRNYPGDYPPDWEWRKREVKERDKYTCQASKEKVGIPECGKTLREDKLHVHHIIPISKGGDHSFENLITLCSDCHDKLHTHMRLNLDVSTSSTTSRRQMSPKVRTLQDAIANEKEVWLDYYTKYRDDRNERIVTPINIYYRNGAAYLRALCHLRREERTFRISRIKNMRVLDSDD